MNKFIRELKKHRQVIPQQTLKTIRGQALNGDLEGARKGLATALAKQKKNR